MLLDRYPLIVKIVALLVVMLLAGGVVAQCPMCKMAAESNLENGGSEGKGLNTGILYMLVLPYLLVGTIGYLWWRNNRKIELMEEQDEVKDLMSA